MTPARSARVLAAVTAAVLLGGCGASVVSGTPSPAGQAAATSADPADAAGSSPSDGGLDVCSFYTIAEVKDLIGIDTETLTANLPDGTRECGWQDPDGDDQNRSVLISVGAPGTAAGGTLPQQEGSVALPDGLRRIANIVSFVCGGSRECRVAVTGQEGRDAEVKIATGMVDRIRSKVGS